MSQQWAELLLFICVVAQFFCVTASTTSASRMIFAFSRDRAVPGHQLWRRVAKNRVPRWSVVFVAFWSGILMVPAIWNYFIGYAVGTAIAVNPDARLKRHARRSGWARREGCPAHARTASTASGQSWPSLAAVRSFAAAAASFIAGRWGRASLAVWNASAAARMRADGERSGPRAAR